MSSPKLHSASLKVQDVRTLIVLNLFSKQTGGSVSPESPLLLTVANDSLLAQLAVQLVVQAESSECQGIAELARGGGGGLDPEGLTLAG